MPLRYHSSSSEAPMAPRNLQLATGASPLYRPAAPISPPETEKSAQLLSAIDPQHAEAAGPSPSTQLSPPEGQDYSRHIRRKPSLQYTQSGLNPRSPAQRTTRWLVVVIPPSSLETEPPLGHTLSMSPPGRFQSGILVPLFPTLYGQLAAIAREFNLPSTTGVCIYLHASDRGMTFSPRISDESWQLLWSPYFNMEESTSPGSITLPIAGQIEFDVDVRRAKWYEAWSNGHEHKITLDSSIPPTIANTMSRWYKEHRSREASDDLDTPGDDGTTVYSGVQMRARPVPRPLTLAGREGSVSSRSVSKYRAVNGPAGDSIDAAPSKRQLYPKQLSPVIQVDEPRTAKQDELNTLVRNWRASTPIPALPAGQDTSLPDTQSMIDLDDYQWSISSAGPPRELYSPSVASEYALLSGGLVARMAGSVVVTPSICTSFGPDLVPTPTHSNVSRYPSPDVAGRFIEDVGLTPTTATSWGAPLSWPTSAASVSIIETPDIAARGFISRPVTPSTATSWGAPSVWPSSPAVEPRPSTPDLGHRADLSPLPTPATATSWGAPEVWPQSPFEESRPATPDVATRELEEEHDRYKPYLLVWPFSESSESFTFSTTPASAIREKRAKKAATTTPAPAPSNLVWPFFEPKASSSEPSANTSVWPYFIADTKEASPSQDVWPYFTTKEPAPSQDVWPFFTTKEPTPSQNVWPYFTAKEATPSQDVWPYFMTKEPAPSQDVWPYFVAGSSAKEATPSQNVWPYFTTREPTASQDVWPYFVTKEPAPSQDVWPYFTATNEATPSHNVWPFFQAAGSSGKSSPNQTVWPYFEAQLPISVGVTGVYPALCIYPPVYPHLVIYPESAENLRRSITSSQAEKVCGPFDYPNLVIYPPSATHLSKQSGTGQRQKELSVRLTPPYPMFDLYPAVYPAVTPYPSQNNSPATSRKAVTKQGLSVRIAPVYPGFDLYPALYPAVVPYPPCLASEKVEKVTSSKLGTKQGLSVRIAPAYPGFDLYPALYPAVVPYPPCVAPEKVEKVSKPREVSSQQSLSVQLNSHYPFFNLYPALYPSVVPYPPCRATSSESKVSSKAVPQTTRLSPPYPFFDLYPAGYPYIAPYPASPVKPVTGGSKTKNAGVSQVARGIAAYPAFNLYPPAYPFFDLYPAIKEKVTGLQSSARNSGTKVQPLTTRLPSHYPTLDIYPAGYPVIQLYPPVKQKAQPLRVVSPYSYPRIVIYAPVSGDKSHLVPVKTRLPRAYPDLDLYPAGYPHLEIYPARKLALDAKSPLLPGARYDYPNICIYPSVGRSQPVRQVAPIGTPKPTPVNRPSALVTSPTKVRLQARKVSFSSNVTSPESRRPRKTHSDLHFEVFGRRPRAGTLTSSTLPLKKFETQAEPKQRKTHAELVFEVFGRSERGAPRSTPFSHNRSPSSRSSTYSTHSRAPSGVGMKPLRLLETQTSSSVASLRRAVSAQAEEAEPRPMVARSRSTYTPSPVPQRVRSGYIAPSRSSTMSSSLSSSPEEYGEQSLLRSSVYSSARSSVRSDIRSTRPRNYDAIIEALSSGAETPIAPASGFSSSNSLNSLNSVNSLNGPSKPDVITQRANRFLKQGDYEFLAKRISQTESYLSPGQSQAQAQRQSQAFGQGQTQRQSVVGLGAATMSSQRPARPISKLDRSRYPFAQ